MPRSTIPKRHERRRMGDSVDSFPVLCRIHPRAGKLPAVAAPHRAKRQRLVVTRLGGVPRPLLLRLPLRARLEPCQGAGSHGRADWEATGFDTGFGLYLNYAFALAWLADAAWWHLAKQNHQSRPRWMDATLHSFMALMWFNATVVFGSPWGQVAGWAAVLGLGGWFMLQRRQAV